jgi:hypothetical protein
MNTSQQMKRWHISLIGLLAIMLAGCNAIGTARQSAEQQDALPTAAAEQRDTLYIRVADGANGQLTIINPVSKAPGTLPLGTLDRSRTTLYTVDHTTLKGHTTVRATDPTTGQTLRETQLKGHYELPIVSLERTPIGLSPNGRWLTLAETSAKGGAETQGQFAILDTAFEEQPTIIQLKGQFSFDAISDDGGSLYLTEHAPEDASKYQVRLYHVRKGMLDERVIVDKRNVLVMQGVRHAALPSPDGRWMFTMYLNEQHGPFIHALNATEQYALCINLPRDGMDDAGKQLRWSLALAPKGDKLYAVNGALGLVAELDTITPQIVRQGNLFDKTITSGPVATHDAAHVQAAQNGTQSNVITIADAAGDQPVPSGYAAITPDGATLFAPGERGIVAVNTDDLALRGSYLTDYPIANVALNADGSRLYSVSAERGILQLDPATGELQGEIESAADVLDVLWVSAG